MGRGSRRFPCRCNRRLVESSPADVLRATYPLHPLACGKIFLPERYDDIRADTDLDRYAVDRAADDLYALGLIDLRTSFHRCVIELLFTEIDALATGPKGGLR